MLRFTLSSRPPASLIAASAVVLFGLALTACELVDGGSSDGASADVPFHRLHGFFVGYNSPSPTLVFRTEAEWNALVEPATSEHVPSTPNFADSLVLAVKYGEVPVDQTGGEIISVERESERVVVRASQRVQPYPIAMADGFKESFVQVAKADVGEHAQFVFEVPTVVDTAYTQP